MGFIDERIRYRQYKLDENSDENRDEFYSVYTCFDEIVKEKHAENSINKK